MQAEIRKMTNKNIQRKAKFMAPYIGAGRAIDLGSEDINWDECLHNHLERFTGRSIMRCDQLGMGAPDIVADFNEPFFFHRCGHGYETIIVSEVIEHLDTPLEFLKGCAEMLDEGGVILLTTPNACSPAEMQGIKMKPQNKLYGQHLFAWNKQNMFYLADKAGLEVKEFKYISFYWNRNYFLRALAWAVPFLRPNMFLVLRRKK